MIALVNPNTTRATTAAMVRIAWQADPRLPIRGLTAPFGAPLITEPAALDAAARAVMALAPRLARARAVVVAAFGDPARAALRARLDIPVTGIAEAGLRAAARGGRRVAVVTTTPALRNRIAATAAAHGVRDFAGTWVTPGDPAALTADPRALRRALAAACGRAVSEGGAQAIVIGGGPLAAAARALAADCPVPLIEPLPAAIRLTGARLARRAPL